jgi:TetR/AcrR family transcriptional regulator
MRQTRRPGDESRALLIEAAVEIINGEGYAALTARRLAEKVGLKRQIVHYYFNTMDDLLLAVVKHYGEEGLARFAEAMQTQNPLRVIWEMRADSSATSFAYLAMATHLPAIRAEVLRYLRKFRELQSQAVADYCAKHGIDLKWSPVAAVMIVQSVSTALLTEAALGNQTGHAETKEAIEELLQSLTEPHE